MRSTVWLCTLLLLIPACRSEAPSDVTATVGPAPNEQRTPDAERTPTVSPTSDAVPERPTVVQPLPEEAVVAPAEGERWANPGWTVSHDGALWMFRNSFSEFPGSSRTDLLRSTDGGGTWTEVGPVLTSEQVEATDGNAFVMSGWIDGDGWHAVVATYDGPSTASVLLRMDAPDPDGPWVIRQDPILQPGAAGGFDDLRIREPSLAVAGDGTLHLYYTGWASVGGAGAIGLATSDDGGATWEAQGPVLVASQAWEEGGVGGAQVVAVDDGWLMVYDSSERGVVGAGIATSEDGRTWTPWAGNPMLDRDQVPGGQSVFQTEVVEHDGPLTYLLEVGGGSGTEIHLSSLDADAVLQTDELPAMQIELTRVEPTVQLMVTMLGVELAFDEADRSGATLHPHAFVDRPPPRTGSAIPFSPGIVHATRPLLDLGQLQSGSHTVWVVAGDGADRVRVPPQPIRVEVEVP